MGLSQCGTAEDIVLFVFERKYVSTVCVHNTDNTHNMLNYQHIMIDTTHTHKREHKMTYMTIIHMSFLREFVLMDNHHLLHAFICPE